MKCKDNGVSVHEVQVIFGFKCVLLYPKYQFSNKCCPRVSAVPFLTWIKLRAILLYASPALISAAMQNVAPIRNLIVI